MREKKHFIRKSIKRPGALTRKAKAAHMTVKAFARKHEHDSGLTGQESRFAEMLAGLNHKRGSKRSEGSKRSKSSRTERSRAR